MIESQTEILLQEINGSIHETFQDVAEKSKHHLAIVDGFGEITYGDLLGTVNRMAQILREHGVGQETPVVLHLPQSRYYVIALLSVLQVGGVYIPVDEHYPVERIAYMLQDSQAALVITTLELSQKLSDMDTKMLLMDASHVEPPSGDLVIAENVMSEKRSPDHPACIIYTSGSTGKPKGIVLSHRSLLNLASSGSYHFALEQQDRFLQVASISFSAALEELYPPLLTGCTMVFSAENSSPPSIVELLATMNQHKVTVCEMVTPLWHELIRFLESGDVSLPDSLRLLITGGERPLLDHYLKWCQHNIKLIHVYGPTEYAATATYHHCDQAIDVEQSITSEETGSEWRLSIGEPILRTMIYVLDEELHQVPAGSYGEIYISGDSLATYYANRPGLTADKFVPDPFSHVPGTRMYKSGDVGRYLPDGRLEFVGRVDNQLKIRGYRVEPGEVEKVLETHPSVKQAVVLGMENELGSLHLVAYLVGADEQLPTTNEWRTYLQDLLPTYMIPSFYLEIDEVPLTLHGKIDRQALKGIGQAWRGNAQEKVAPEDAEEAALLSIWEDVFHHSEIGCLHDFFELGGHSLLALRIVAQIRDQFKMDVQPNFVFQHRTIREMVAELKQMRAGGSGEQDDLFAEIKQQRNEFPENCYPISISQNGIWFLQQLMPDSSLYNVPWRFNISGNVQIDLFEQAINELVRRHTSLQSNFKMIDNQVMMCFDPACTVGLQVQDMRHLDANQRAAQLTHYLNEEAYKPFDLEKDTLLRAYLVRTGESEYVAMFNVHHIVFDGWSLEIFMQDVGKIYSALVEGRSPDVPTREFDYADYALWQRDRLQGERLEEGLAYWASKLEKIEHFLEIGDIVQETNRAGNSGKTIVFHLELDEQSVRSAAKESETTIFIFLLAVFKVVLFDFTRQPDVIVGAASAGGRIVHQFSNVIGYFVNTLVMRDTIDEEASFHQFLEQVKQTAMEAYQHQDIPLDLVLQKVRTKRKRGRNPMFQVDFLLEEDPLQQVAFSGLHVAQLEDIDTGISKFDLTWMLKQKEDGLHLHAIFNQLLISDARIEQMVETFTQVLQRVIDQPDLQIRELLSN